MVEADHIVTQTPAPNHAQRQSMSRAYASGDQRGQGSDPAPGQDQAKHCASSGYRQHGGGSAPPGCGLSSRVRGLCQAHMRGMAVGATWWAAHNLRFSALTLQACGARLSIERMSCTEWSGEMIVGYSRVSTDGQTGYAQKAAPRDTEVVDVFAPPREDFLAGATRLICAHHSPPPC